LFGIGAGLAMDEFALWVRLEDVYWSEEGRASIDASVIAIVMMGLIFLEVRPFAISSSTPVDVAATLEPPIVLSLVVLCFAKQRFFHGTIGFFIWPLAVYGAVRIGKPQSPWAHWRYTDRRLGKQAKAQERFRARPADRAAQRSLPRCGWRNTRRGLRGETRRAGQAPRAPGPVPNGRTQPAT
jgi:hypothetical protein